MVKLVARNCISTAFHERIPRAEDHDIKIGSEVLLYKERPINMWVGPYRVVAGDSKHLSLNLKGNLVPASVDKVKASAGAFSDADFDGQPAEQQFQKEFGSLIDRVASGRVFFRSSKKA